MKGLKSLKDIFNYIYTKATTYEEDVKLNNDREIIEKELKAFDIVREKDVDLRTLKTCFKVEYGLQKYNKQQRKENELTQAEYDLLKEVL